MPARAQGNYEIQVYGADTVEPKSTMVELHSNYTPDGQKYVIDGVYPTNHQEHETLEITQGLTSWSEVGFYVFTSGRTAMACSGWGTTSGRGCGCPIRGIGRWASAYRPRSAISGRSIRPIPGPGRYGRSSTSTWAAGIWL